MALSNNYHDMGDLGLEYSPDNHRKVGVCLQTPACPGDVQLTQNCHSLGYHNCYTVRIQPAFHVDQRTKIRNLRWNEVLC